MKKFIAILIIYLLIPATSYADIEAAKSQCKELGFEPGTEKYADCVMKLLPKEKTKNQNINLDKTIKAIDKNVKKVGEDIAESLKIEVAIKGKKLENFFINNDLILISENGSREYRFKEKTYEIIKDDTVIQSGSWRVHGLLKNQVRLISQNDKKKYYLKKISKKPWIYNYDRAPTTEGASANKEILHIKSSSKFSDISSDVKFSSNNEKSKSKKLDDKKEMTTENTTEISKKDEKKNKENITEAKEIQNNEIKTEVSKKDEKKNKENITLTKKTKNDDGIDLLSSTKTQKKSKNTDTKSNLEKIDGETISFKLTDSRDTNFYIADNKYSLANISDWIDYRKNSSKKLLGDIVNIHTGSDGFYKGGMINNLPEGKGKWSNCHRERFSKLDLSKTIESCEIIVGNWKNGTLNGYAKIFYLGSPTKIPDLESLWKDVDINTNFLTTNFSDSLIIDEKGWINYGYQQGPKSITRAESSAGVLEAQRINNKKRYATIFVGNFQNNVIMDDLSARITSNKGQMTISSLNEDGIPDGIGVTLYSDGSTIIGIYENGKLNLDNNIISFIKTDKKIKNLKSSQMGSYLEKYQGTYSKYKNFLHAALLDNNFIKKSDKKRKIEFKLKATYFKKYDKFPFIKQMVWGKSEISAAKIGSSPSLNPSSLSAIYANGSSTIPYSYVPIDYEKSSFGFYRGKISKINEKGQLVYNGRAIKINYNDEYFSLEEGDFKDGLFVNGFQIYDTGSKPRVNIPLNFVIKVSGQREKKLNHTAEVYYGSLNEKGPNGTGTMVMPNGMVYIGEWKDNRFHGNGELKKYGNKQPYRNKSNQTKTIPSLKYSLKGNFEDGKPQGKMEGYVFHSESDAAGVLTDIIKKDISGKYDKGKLIESSVVKKVEKKKLDRPKFEGQGDPTEALVKAEQIAKQIGCVGYEMKGTVSKYEIYPCASYEEYEKAFLKLEGEKKENLTSDKRTFKAGKALFTNIKNETEKSFFVDDVEVLKYQNKTKIKKIDFNSSQCKIIDTKYTTEGDLYYENENYLIDIENGIIVRKRVDKVSKKTEEKTFNIREIIGDFERLDYTFYDQDKKSYILTESKDRIKEFIIKNKNSKFFEIKTHPIEVIRQIDFSNNQRKDYSVALSDEMLTILIPLNFEQGKGAYSLDKQDIKYLKKNYSIINSSYGVMLDKMKAGNEKWAYFDPIDKGKQTKTACTKLLKDKESSVDIASKEVSPENIVGTMEYYLKNIKQAGLYGLANYGIDGEEEPFFEAYAFNSSQKVSKNSEENITARLENTAEVLKLHEVKFTNVLQCKNPNFDTPDLFFVGIDKTIIKAEQLKTVKEKYPDKYSEIPVFHIARFSKNINPGHAENSYIRGEDEFYDLITEDIYDWRRSKVYKDIIIEKVENDTITLEKNFTKIKDWQQRFTKGHIIQQSIKIDLKNDNVNYKHMIFFAGDSSSPWYQPPEQVEYNAKCENISIN